MQTIWSLNAWMENRYIMKTIWILIKIQSTTESKLNREKLANIKIAKYTHKKNYKFVTLWDIFIWASLQERKQVKRRTRSKVSKINSKRKQFFILIVNSKDKFIGVKILFAIRKQMDMKILKWNYKWNEWKFTVRHNGCFT